MFAPVLRGEFIGGATRRDRLQQLLQLALGIDFQWLLFELLEFVFHFLENETPDGLEIAVEVNRANERFKGVAQRGIASPATARFFAAAHQQVPAKIEAGRVHLERFTRDEARPAGRQPTFPGFAVTREEVLGDDELQNSIAQELEALVVELRPLLFMRDARMSERLREELRILKLITNAFFERVHEGDRQGARLVCFS